jgi:hypothetical protein
MASAATAKISVFFFEFFIFLPPLGIVVVRKFQKSSS